MYVQRPCDAFFTSGAERGAPPELYISRYLSGNYHFLIYFESGLVKWYLKVVYEIFDSFQLLRLICFSWSRIAHVVALPLRVGRTRDGL